MRAGKPLREFSLFCDCIRLSSKFACQKNRGARFFYSFLNKSKLDLKVGLGILNDSAKFGHHIQHRSRVKVPKDLFKNK